MSDPTITAVANGTAPQPVAVQQAQPSPTEVASQVAGNGEMTPEEIASAEKAGEISKQEAQSLRKKLTLKVDGQEFEEELDFNDDEGLKRHLQKSKAFDKRLKEHSQYKNNVDQFLKRLQDDPEGLLEEMGYDVDSMSEKRLAKKVEELKKSPEQLEKEKMQKELETLKKKIKEEADQKEQLALESAKNQHAQEIQHDIISSLDSAKSKLPKNNPRVVEMVGQNMLFAMRNGFPNVTAKDVIPIVEKQYKEEIRRLMDASPEDFIEEYVGKENLDRYRKKQLAATRATAKTTTAKQMVQDTGTTKKKEEVKPKKSYKQLFSYHDE